jgi:ABC-type amino acid transport substrate-binding protein
VCLEHGVRGLVCVALGYTLGVSNLWAEETKIVFGGEAAYPPFEWNDRGTPRGFNIELEQAIAEAGGVEVEHRLGDWSETIRALEAGDVDVVPMFFSEQRERSFVFTPPFQFVSHGIYAREGTAHISSVDDLAGSHIAVERASYAHQYIEAEGLSVQLVLTPNTLTALQAVADGRAEYAALAAPTANYLIRARNLALNNVGPPLWPRSYAFAVRKDRIELAEWLTQRFYEVLRTGAYQQVYGRWEDQLALTEEGTLARVFGYATLPATVLALLGLVWAWRLRGTVLARTRSLVDEVERRRDAEAQARRAFAGRCPVDAGEFGSTYATPTGCCAQARGRRPDDTHLRARRGTGRRPSLCRSPELDEFCGARCERPRRVFRLWRERTHRFEAQADGFSQRHVGARRA